MAKGRQTEEGYMTKARTTETTATALKTHTKTPKKSRCPPLTPPPPHLPLPPTRPPASLSPLPPPPALLLAPPSFLLPPPPPRSDSSLLSSPPYSFIPLLPSLLINSPPPSFLLPPAPTQHLAAAHGCWPCSQGRPSKLLNLPSPIRQFQHFPHLSWPLLARKKQCSPVRASISTERKPSAW